MNAHSTKLLKGFADAAHSLKLYRRAELLDQKDKPLIEQLYVDPLPGDQILNTMTRPNTTFLIGRKGTGKSTVFQRAQYEIRKKTNAVSAYIDVKTVYESATVDSSLLQKAASKSNALTEDQVRRLLLYKSFIRAVLEDVRGELKKQFNSTLLGRLKDKLGTGRKDILEALDEVLTTAFEADFDDVTGLEDVGAKSGSVRNTEAMERVAAELQAGMGSSGLTASGKLTTEVSSKRSEELEEERTFSRVLLRKMNITQVIAELEQILKSVDIRHLYIFIDDFSELPEEAMQVFVDTVLAPLNNWSNELIKFKVAAYPGRIYYGKIDRTKIDEQYLDLFKLYGTNDVGTMEEKAVEFTRRLVNNRLQHFCKTDLTAFSGSDITDIERQLFYATMGNPRNLGHILFNLQESHVAHGSRITVRAVRDAAAKYYEEKIEPFFGMQKFRQEAFSERASVFSLKELVEEIVKRARELRSYRGSSVLKTIEGQPPTSHFHVVTELEGLLSTLELNFFVTKYFEMKDRDGRKVSVFAINYGLCNKYSIEFGRPGMKREHRLYFVERIFDYTSILRRFLQQNQEIKCDSCHEVYGEDKIDSLAMYDMMCPKCKKGTCQVVNLSKKYETTLSKIRAELLLPETELNILEALFIEDRELYAREIAEDLDCSYQLVGKRGKIMEDRGLVNRRQEKSRRVYGLTKQAKQDYFAGNDERRLAVED